MNRDVLAGDPDGTYCLRRLTDDHVDDYALRVDAMYVEFSDVMFQDDVFTLNTTEGGMYVTVRGPGLDGIPEDIAAALREIEAE